MNSGKWPGRNIKAWILSRSNIVFVTIDCLWVMCLFCFIMWILSFSQAKGVQSDLAIHDTVIVNTEKIRNLQESSRKFEEDQEKQWTVINALKDDMSIIKDEMATALRFLYLILGAILVKGVIDVLRSRQTVKGL